MAKASRITPAMERAHDRAAVSSLLTQSGEAAIGKLVADIEIAVRRSDDYAVTELDRLLRKLERLDAWRHAARSIKPGG
jgi:hypothetical protein